MPCVRFFGDVEAVLRDGTKMSDWLSIRDFLILQLLFVGTDDVSAVANITVVDVLLFEMLLEVLLNVEEPLLSLFESSGLTIILPRSQWRSGDRLSNRGESAVDGFLNHFIVFVDLNDSFQMTLIYMFMVRCLLWLSLVYWKI